MDNTMRRKSIVSVILKDLLISYILTGILLLLLTFLALKMDISNSITSGGIVLTYILSAFLGGFLLGKSAEQRRFLWGLGMGAIYFVVLILLSLLTDSVMGLETSRMLSSMIICLFSGMLGGMIS